MWRATEVEHIIQNSIWETNGHRLTLFIRFKLVNCATFEIIQSYTSCLNSNSGLVSQVANRTGKNEQRTGKGSLGPLSIVSLPPEAYPSELVPRLMDLKRGMDTALEEGSHSLLYENTHFLQSHLPAFGPAYPLSYRCPM